MQTEVGDTTAPARVGGGVELREDVPLKGSAVAGAGAGGGMCAGAAGGARAVQACFAALSVGIALALLAQVLGGGAGGAGAAGHGAVAAGAAACSRAGAALLQAGGGALDAAAAAAVCLAAQTPHRTSLDASGALLLWRYRTEHGQPPLLAQWGAAGQPAPAAPDTTPRGPRLLCALAALHAAHGALAWPLLLQPTLDLIALVLTPRKPRLLCALAALHAAHGALAWPLLLQPTLDLIALVLTPRKPRLLCALAALHAAHGALAWPLLLQPTLDLIALVLTPRKPRLLCALAALHAAHGALAWPLLLQPTLDLIALVLTPRKPRLLYALAALHAAHGALAWPLLLQPTLDLIAAESPPSPEHAQLAAYLRRAQNYTSAELAAAATCGAEGAGGGVRVGVASGTRAGRWRVWHAGGRGAAALAAAVTDTASPSPALAALDPLDRAVYRAAAQLAAAPAADDMVLHDTPASGLAVVDRRDTYVALVTGLSTAGGSGEAGGAGWQYDEPAAPLDLAPAIFAEDLVCGTRYVVGAESSAALAQAGAALLAGAGGAEGVERARLAGRGGELAPPPPAGPAPAAPLLALAHGATSLPGPAVNIVIQRGDALASHADSRAGGLASRF